MDAINLRSLMLICGGLKSDMPITDNSLYNLPMPSPINDEDDMEAFAKIHRDVLGGWRLRWEARG